MTKNHAFTPDFSNAPLPAIAYPLPQVVVPPTNPSVAWGVDADGDWSQAANWAGGKIPTASSSVTLSSAHTHTVTHSGGADSIFNLVSTTDLLALTGGTLTIASASTIGGGLSDTGGGMLVLKAGASTAAGVLLDGNGTLSVAKAAALAIGGAATIGDTSGGFGSFSGGGTISTSGAVGVAGQTNTTALYIGGGTTWTNSGAVTVSGYITYGNSNGDPASATIVNQAGGSFSFLDNGNLNSQLNNPAAGVFTNLGTLSRGGGTGTSTMAAVLNNSGLISITAGTLELLDGGSLAGTLAGAGMLLIGAGNVTTSSAIAGAGTLGLASGGTLSSTGIASFGGAVSSDGTLAAATHDTLTLSGAVTLGDASGGYAVFTGGGTIATSGAVTVGGNPDYTGIYVADATTWANSGVVTVAGYVSFGLSGDTTSASIVNLAGGTFNFVDGGNSNELLNNTANAFFTNMGTLSRGGTNLTSVLTASLNNTGLIAVNAGTLALMNGGTLGGTLSGAGILQLGAGTFNTAAAIAGTGTLAIASGATFNSTGNASFGGAVDDLGTMSAGAGDTLTLTGSVTFGNGPGTTLGTLSGPGTLVTAGATSLPLTGGVVADLAMFGGVTWVNAAGGIATIGGYINVGQSNDSKTNTIINQAGATIDFAGDYSTIQVVGGPGLTITNAGTLAKISGTVSSYVSATVNSTGVLAAASGTLALEAGGSIAGTVSGAGVVLLDSGLFTTNSAIAGAGTLGLGASGELLVTGNASFGGTVSGIGTLGATAGHTLTLTGAVTLGAGQGSQEAAITGPGTIVTTGMTLLPLTSGVVSDLAFGGGATWINSGIVSVGGYINVGFASDTAQNLIVNQAGASFDLTSDYSAMQVVAGLGFSITNAGTLAKTSGTGISTIAGAINSTGVLSATSGTLAFEAGGSVAGTIAGAGLVLLDSGNFTINSAVAGTGRLGIGGAGTLTTTGAASYSGALQSIGLIQLAAADPLALSGAVTFGNGSSGTVVNGPGTLTTSGVTTLATTTSAVLDLQLSGGATWVNSGSTTVGGYINLGAGGDTTGVSIINTASGTFAFTSDQGQTQFTGAPSASFSNAGTLSKTGGTGTTYLETSLINSGLTASYHGTLTMTSAVTNTGTMLASGGTLDMSQAAVSNLSGTTLTGGAYQANASSVIEWATNTTIVTDSASITLSGTGSQIQALNGATGKQVTLDSTLGTISNAGTLALLAGRNFTSGAAGTFTVGGLLSLGGVAFKAGKIAVTPTGTVSGSGTVTGTLSDAGHVLATGGTLVLASAVTGTGALQASAGAVLNLAAGGALTEAISGAGTLRLDGATAYTLAGANAAIATVQVDAGATLSGFGTLAGALADAGTLIASGGTLLVSGAVSGGGSMQAAAGAKLDLAGGGSFSGAIGGAGTLQLDGSAALVLQTGAVLSTASVVVDAGATLDLANGGALNGTISGTGTLLLDGAAGYTLSGATLNLGTIGVDTGASLSGFGTLTAAVTDNGSLTASGGTLAVGGAITGAGALAASAGATLDLLAGGAFSGAISGAGTLKLDGTAAFTVQAGGTLGAASVVIDAGATLDLANAGAGAVSLGGSITGAGTLRLDGGTYTLGSALGAGLVMVDAGAALGGPGVIAGALADSGSVYVNTGTLTVGGAVSGTGSFTAGAGATLEFSGGGALSGAVSGAVSGAGTLLLDGASAFTLAAGAQIQTASTIVATGTGLSGAGLFTGAVTDNGSIAASAGGTLVFAGAVSGAGTLSAGTGGLLDMKAGGVLSEVITGAGALELESGAYTLAGAHDTIGTVTVASDASLSGFGTLAAAAMDSGTITATGGMLVLAGPVSGGGTLLAAAGAVLDLTAGGALNTGIGGLGTLELGGAFSLGTGALTAASLAIDAGASLSGAGALTSSLAVSGLLSAAGGTLILTGPLAGTGTLAAAAGATLDLLSTGSFGGTIGGAGTVDFGAALTLTNGASLSAGTIVELANVTLGASAQVTLAATSTLDITAAAKKTVTLSGPATAKLTNSGTLIANGAGTAAVNVACINTGDITVSSGTLSFLGAMTNNGIIDQAAGVLSFKKAVAGTGTLQIGAAGTLALALGAAAGQTADFTAGTGLLDLTKAIDFKGMIAGFGGGDQIDLLKTVETSFTFANGVLTVKDGATTEASLHFAGAYTSNSFSLASDLHGGTMITFV